MSLRDVINGILAKAWVDVLEGDIKPCKDGNGVWLLAPDPTSVWKENKALPYKV